MEAVIDGRLDRVTLDIDRRAAVCVVMASKGYPGSYPKGLPIRGLDAAKGMQDVAVFHAGTARKQADVVTDGGRVLGVTALGDTVEAAIATAYAAVGAIGWDGAYCRKDIGRKALKRLALAPAVGIVMGSDSDLGIMEESAAMLKKFGIPFEMTVASAHRSPERAMRFASTARERGMKVIIAGAGHAAHLAGVMAAHTPLPVIGVPIDSSSLQGLDSLLSTVQMPPGIPVATMALGKSGARNAGIFAAQIVALADPAVAGRIDRFKKEMASEVERKAEALKDYR
jgi:phosphoribosylamine--glycine ligase